MSLLFWFAPLMICLPLALALALSGRSGTGPHEHTQGALPRLHGPAADR
jgi:hypothetical protein